MELPDAHPEQLRLCDLIATTFLALAAKRKAVSLLGRHQLRYFGTLMCHPNEFKSDSSDKVFGLRMDVGSVAATCSTLAYLPRAVRTWRTRSTTDISITMFSMMVLATTLWLIYGIALDNWPIIGANGVTLVLSVIILFLKLRYG
jgi:MtN3 and saliva related transmembrane protein